MPNNSGKYIELLYDHYKDTFEQIKGYVKWRNTCTIIILSLVVFLSFQVSNTEVANSISMEVVRKNIGKIHIEFEYIKTVLYIALLWVLTTYYQTILTIEKLYPYIHKIEEQLTDVMKPFKIEREGKSYLTQYPLLLDVIDKLYTIFFPISIVLFAVFNWINEKSTMDNYICNFCINSIVLFCITIVSLLYLSYKHFKDFIKKK